MPFGPVEWRCQCAILRGVRVAFEVAKGAFHLRERQLGDRSVVRSMPDHPSFIESNPMVRLTLFRPTFAPVQLFSPPAAFRGCNFIQMLRVRCKRDGKSDSTFPLKYLLIYYPVNARQIIKTRRLIGQTKGIYLGKFIIGILLPCCYYYKFLYLV